MTVTATNASTSATGNGAATAFPFTFFAPDPSQVAVSLNGVQQNSGYSVTTMPGAGGTVTFDVAPANGVTVLIELDPSFEQNVDFTNGPFLPSSVNNALDQGTARDIYLNGQVGSLGTGLSAETAARETADANVAANTSAISVEVAARQAGDGGLQSQVSAIVNAATNINNASLNAASRAILAALNHTTALPAILTESGREGTFVFSSANLSTQVAADPKQIKYVAPLSDTTGASGAWVRKADVLRPSMAGTVGDGVTDDSVALQAFNDFFFAAVRPEFGDFSGTYATTQNIRIGPSSSSGVTFDGQRFRVGGDLRIIATTAITAEIVTVQYLQNTHWHGRICATGTGGTTFSSRTCGLGIRVWGCATSRIGELKADYTQYHGVLFDCDGTNFDDDMQVGCLNARYCGSSGISSQGQTANWSSPVNSGTSGSTGQLTTINVSALPPAIVDSYEAYSTNKQVTVVINRQPYKVAAVDRVNNTISLYPWLDSNQVSLGSGSLSYIFGGGYSVRGGDSGIVHFDKVAVSSCGIGMSENSLYGSVVASADIEVCGIALATGGGEASSHVGGSYNFYGEACTFDWINFGLVSVNGFKTIAATYAFSLAKCFNLADPRLSDDRYGLNGGGLGTVTDGACFSVSVHGKTLAWHARSLHQPESGTIQFNDHRREPLPVTRNLNSATIQLNNLLSGQYNVLFGYRGNTWRFIGTGTNFAPTGTFTFAPPTLPISCTTNSTTTVTTADTRALVVGMPITGANIPGSTTISSITNRTTFVISNAATSSTTLNLTVTGSVSVNGGAATFGNVAVSGFGGPAEFLIVHTDLYEMQWSVSTTSGQHRVNITPLGYATGSGGAVTQATSRTTGVTLNKTCGQITLFSAAGSASWATFTVTNSQVAATDVIRLNQASGTDKYMLHVTGVRAGAFDVTFATTGGTTTEQPVFNFAVIKAVAA